MATIRIRRGDTKTHQVNLPVEDEFANPIDWSTATFRSQIRKTKSLTAPLLAEWDIDATHSTDVVDPYVLMILDAVVTTALKAPADAFCDFQETRAGSGTRTPMEWKVKIVPDVTHD